MINPIVACHNTSFSIAIVGGDGSVCLLNLYRLALGLDEWNSPSRSKARLAVFAKGFGDGKD